MAKTIRLESGGYVTRSWGGEGGYLFEVGLVDNSIPNDRVIIRPNRREMLAIGALFRRAALKAKKSEGKSGEEYEAPTLKRLCNRPPAGWWCSREPDHDGPCAAREFEVTDLERER